MDEHDERRRRQREYHRFLDKQVRDKHDAALAAQTRRLDAPPAPPGGAGPGASAPYGGSPGRGSPRAPKPPAAGASPPRRAARDAGPETDEGSSPYGGQFPPLRGAAIETSPVLSLDGRTVYAGSDSPLLYTIDASNGTLVWQFEAKHSQAGAFWSSSATISADGKTLYASHQDDYLYAIWT